MRNAEKINRLTGRFASQETEAAYQAFVFRRHLRSNIWGVAIGIAFVALYTFSEFIDSPAPSGGVAVRGVAAILSTLLLLVLFHDRTARHHDAVTTAIIILMGVATNYNIWRQPSLDNTFYIGLIQGYIMFSLLLRLSFTSIVLAIAATQATFAAVVFSKADIQNAILQSANTMVVGVICIAGVYLLQRYQRTDFLKSQTIEEQNTRLKGLLDDVQRDNERKIAALNLLVHFVKTPLHQINGFSDIVLNSLNSEEGSAAHEQGVEGARYIKNATANLSKSVNSLLTYHRLDEVERSREYDTVDLDAAFADLGEMICADTRVKIDGKAGALLTVPMAVKTVAQCLAGYYNESLNGATSLEVALSRAGDAARIVVADNGRALTREEFVEKTKPLTKIDSYLTSAGAQLPMLLRTVARAVELCGGEFGHAPLGAGNEFVITLREARPAAVMADRIAAA